MDRVKRQICGCLLGWCVVGCGARTGLPIEQSTDSSTQQQRCEQEWGITFDGVAMAVAANATGEVFVLGIYNQGAHIGDQTLTSLGEEDIFLACFTAKGSLRWLRTLGTAARDDAVGLAPMPGGGVAAALVLASDQLTVGAWSGSGEPIWIDTYGKGRHQAIAADSQGALYVAGYQSGPSKFVPAPSPTTSQLVLLSLESGGQYRWARTITPGLPSAEVQGIGQTSLDVSEDSVLWGGSILGVWEGLVGGVKTEEHDLFLARLDRDGNLVSSRTIVAKGDQQLSAVRHKGGVSLVGLLNAPTTFGSDTITPLGAQGGFVARMTSELEPLWALGSTAKGELFVGGAVVGAEKLYTLRVNSGTSQARGLLRIGPDKQVVAEVDVQGKVTAYGLTARECVYVVGAMNGQASFGSIALQPTHVVQNAFLYARPVAGQ